MTEIIVKQNKEKINDGGHKPFGVDLDPKKELCHVTTPDKDADAYYKGQKMNYNDYLGELKGRCDRAAKGKSPRSVGYFAGIGEGTLNKK
jgi:hypothetical protein|tara:strand:- start:978 stop:1247 length:270 start_codon:yes stop_codon:yes gene_type:complete